MTSPVSRAPTLVAMVGLPGSGKTTRARELAESLPAIRFTPDEWILPLLEGENPEHVRDVIEGRFVAVATALLRQGVNVILDFGLWSHDERAGLHSLALEEGAAFSLDYLAIDRPEQWRRVRERQRRSPETTFPMTEQDLDDYDRWFEAPDADEVEGSSLASAPEGAESWAAWRAHRWPTADAL